MPSWPFQAQGPILAVVLLSFHACSLAHSPSCRPGPCPPVGAAPQEPASCQAASPAARLPALPRCPLSCRPALCTTPLTASSHSIMLLWLFNSTKFTLLEPNTTRQPWGLSSLLRRMDGGSHLPEPLELTPLDVPGARQDTGGAWPSLPSPVPRSRPLYAGNMPGVCDSCV